MANTYQFRDHQRSVTASQSLNLTVRDCADKLTFSLGLENINSLETYCAEFLVHAADNEGLQQGVDLELVSRLAEWCSIPITYAGGARTVKDLDLVKDASGGKVDLTIGSALDIFGGSGATFDECVEWNNRQ